MYGTHTHTHLSLGSISASEEDHVVLQVDTGHQPLAPHLTGPVCTGWVILVLGEGKRGEQEEREKGKEGKREEVREGDRRERTMNDKP